MGVYGFSRVPHDLLRRTEFFCSDYEFQCYKKFPWTTGSTLLMISKKPIFLFSISASLSIRPSILRGVSICFCFCPIWVEISYLMAKKPFFSVSWMQFAVPNSFIIILRTFSFSASYAKDRSRTLFSLHIFLTVSYM